MKSLVVLALLLSTAFACAQALPDQPGYQYSAYTVLLVSHESGEGYMMGIDKDQKIVFIPIPSIAKSVNNEGVSPVSYGEVLLLLKQLGDENQRLKAENDHLWKVAEGHAPAAEAPATTVIVEQAPPAPQPPQPSDRDIARAQLRQILLRNLFAQPQRSTIDVNVRDCTRYPAACVGH